MDDLKQLTAGLERIVSMSPLELLTAEFERVILGERASKPARRPRRPTLRRVLKEAAKAGAAVVVEGNKFTATLGTADSPVAESNPFEIEAQRLRRQRRDSVMRTRTRPLPPHLKRRFDKRTGKTYLQFRKRGHPLVPLPLPIGSDEFWSAYTFALANKVDIGAKRSTTGGVTATVAAYYAAAQWSMPSDGTRGARRAILDDSARGMENGRCGKSPKTFSTPTL